MILLFEEYQYKNADDIALIKRCVDEAYLTEGYQKYLNLQILKQQTVNVWSR